LEFWAVIFGEVFLAELSTLSELMLLKSAEVFRDLPPTLTELL